VDSSNTGTLGVAGYTTLASNLTVGSGLGGAGTNTLIRLNQFVANTSWSYLCSTDVLGDVSLAANCYTSNGSWYRVNFAGGFSFVSARQGSIKFWVGAPGAISGSGTTDASLTAIMNLSTSGMTVTNTSNTGTLGVAGATTLNTLNVTGLTTLVNSSNTGTLGVAGATTLNTLNVTGLTTLVNSSNTGTMGVAGVITASRYQTNGGNMNARTGGVYNRGADAASSAYHSINWIPGDYTAGAAWNTYDTTIQAACGILCSGQTGQARIEFFLVDSPVQGNAPTRVGYFNSSGFNANAKNFSIEHPVVSSCTLVHASIEGPRYDLIYRNRKQLVNGSAEVDIEKESTANGSKMSPGTFDALCTNADVFLQNNDTFDRIKGYVSSHMLFIECENSNSSAFINWMIIAERHDSHLVNAGTTDASGFLILEHYISTISSIAEISSISSINLDTLSTVST
jgi:hypothetical protein